MQIFINREKTKKKKNIRLGVYGGSKEQVPNIYSHATTGIKMIQKMQVNTAYGNI